ncbi:hypothetical protein WP50_22405 [Lactiplantibacillus plantarum]|nr:hypothetical protein WP50_22405 [Lactiplantibacillus plantarum]
MVKCTPIDIIACENMIGGSQSLKKSVYESLNEDEQAWADQNAGFPNAAVDRIVPLQKHDDPLFVSVEPFKEWVIDKSQMKNPKIQLKGVDYADDLEPYIERKLFSVNTGHDQNAGFPNAAVDRIVPLQKHDDPLFVSVEPFKEWVIDKSQMKNPKIQLKGVDYADDLEPYIERKLFSVNTGHDQNAGFPNAAVDRIVPLQKHDDPFFVSVSPFQE